MAFAGAPAAVRARDLLFLSGLYPVTPAGIAGTHAHDTAPDVQHQAAAIIVAARDICAAAGADFGRLVRAQHFLADIGDRFAVEQVWRAMAPEVPTSVVECADPVMFEGCRIMSDLWVHQP